MGAFAKITCVGGGAFAAFIGGAVAVGTTWGGPAVGMFICFGLPILILGVSVTLAMIPGIVPCECCNSTRCNYRNP